MYLHKENRGLFKDVVTLTKMTVQAMERTLIDKIFALCDYYMQNRPGRNSRHMYDIYKLSAHITKDEVFRKLVSEVREHRCSVDEKVTPSARTDVDIKRLICMMCEEDFYKQDYLDTTSRLTADALDYETVKTSFLKFTEDLF